MRRTLFSKIFLWFWLASTFIGIASAVVTIYVNPKSYYVNRYTDQVFSAGKTLVDIYENQGPAALARQCDLFKQENRINVFLFKESQGPLSGHIVKFEGRHTAVTAATTGVATDVSNARGGWYATPVDDAYTVLAELPPPRLMERLFQPDRLGLILAVYFILAGIFSYQLARSLTAPILQLRKATRQFAGGALATRVGSILKKRKDEIADLGWDFDTMAERIEDLVDSQQKLLQDISHELRSPLARINVALELARRYSGQDSSNALDRIERESERLNQLIGELVTLTLLESGSEKIKKSPVKLQNLVKSVVEDSNFEARDRNRLVRIVSSEALTVNGSEEMLRRAVENVIRNAVRYTDEATVAEVSLFHHEQDGITYAAVQVRDHGSGVPEAALTQLFKPFYRVGDDRDRQTGGTGIGLAITERSVLLHGGTITASNVPSGGLVVKMVFPATKDS